MLHCSILYYNILYNVTMLYHDTLYHIIFLYGARRGRSDRLRTPEARRRRRPRGGRGTPKSSLGCQLVRINLSVLLSFMSLSQYVVDTHCAKCCFDGWHPYYQTQPLGLSCERQEILHTCIVSLNRELGMELLRLFRKCCEGAHKGVRQHWRHCGIHYFCLMRSDPCSVCMCVYMDV